MGVYLISVYLTGVHLMGVYLAGVYLMGVYLMSVHLMGVYLIGVHLMNVPLSWASLAGLSRGHASVSAPKPVSCLRPRASVPYLRPLPPSLAPAPIPTPEPRRSKRTLSIPGHYAVLAGRSPRKPRRGGNVQIATH
jgi:hypothetical protein